MTNIKSELTYYEKKLTETELREVVNTSAVGEVMALENDNDLPDSNELFFKNAEFIQDTLNIEDIIDLTQYYLEGEREVLDINDDNNMQAEPGNMIYFPENL